jgi:hypothetical protein
LVVVRQTALDQTESRPICRCRATATYDSPPTDGKGITYTFTIDLDAAAYSVQDLTPEDQMKKQTQTLEAIAKAVAAKA